MIPQITITKSMPANLPPLAFILLVTAIKDLIEDLQRHHSDRLENSRKVNKYDRSRQCYIEVEWSSLQVGDMIELSKDEQVPADCIILWTSDQKGQCYIETKNLDGETNLKNKQKNQKIKLNRQQLLEMHYNLSYEQPNPYLYQFNGTLEITSNLENSSNSNHSSHNNKYPMEFCNFLLRGCSVKNTETVCGVVVYTGHETKLLLNSIRPRSKRSGVDIKLNHQVLVIFIVQMMFCLFSAITSATMFRVNKQELMRYIPSISNDDQFLFNIVVKYGNWLLMFTNFVPISLLVTLDTVKFIQGIIISKDVGMETRVELKDGKEEKIRVGVQSSQLNEELGQVQYIFSDKTGTLTCNIMNFKKICINGISYGEDNVKQMKTDISNVDFVDPQIHRHLEHEGHKQQIEQCLLFLSLCHTVLVKWNGDKMEYNASSPDELALINFGRMMGYEYQGIDADDNISLSINGQLVNNRYKLLHVLEFNSTRKRQSVVLEVKDDDESTRIMVLTKGADSVIEKRLAKQQFNVNNRDEIQQTWDHMGNYAEQGLRTLVLAQKQIQQQDYQDWLKKYDQASISLVNREEKMMAMYEDIETELQLVGVTAIEDKLQENVGKTIKILKQTGLKVWVLTGDKIETAINIGYSCQLIDDYMKRVVVDGVDADQVRHCLQDAIKDIQQSCCQQQQVSINDSQQIQSMSLEAELDYGKLALVVSGDALIHIMSNTKLKQLMFQITQKCECVLACRVSPKQKMEIVQMVREQLPQITTLAIGDGANDVNMITAAHVGIGIKGVEGHQAARASDYSIGEFQHVRKLTLVYGREAYRKNSALIIYNFYKNMVYVMPQFWLAFLNQFSGQNMFDPFLFQMYNIAYASFPIMVYALSDEQYSEKILMNEPQHYKIGLMNTLFNTRCFWKGVVNGMVTALLITLPSFLMLEQHTFVASNGQTYNFWATGTVVFSAVVIVTNLKILIISHTQSWFSGFILVMSIVFYYLNFMLVSELIPFFDIYGSFELMISSPVFYCVLSWQVFSTSIVEMAIQRISDQGKNEKYVEMVGKSLEGQNLNDSSLKSEKQEMIMGNGDKDKINKYKGYSFSQDEPIPKFREINFRN